MSEINETLKQLESVRDAAVLLHRGPLIPSINDAGEVDTAQLVTCMEALENDEALGLLNSVEKLAEKELDFMLDKMKKSKNN